VFLGHAPCHPHWRPVALRDRFAFNVLLAADFRCEATFFRCAEPATGGTWWRRDAGEAAVGGGALLTV